MSMKYELIHP